MIDLRIDERFTRLDTLIAQGRICRRRWHDGPPTDDGYEHMCLLLSLAPEVGKGEVEQCPAWLMPAWLAHLTPWIDDAGSEERWPHHIAEYRRVVPGVARLSADSQRRLDYAVRAAILRETIDVAGDSKPVVEAVIARCDRAASGEVVSNEEWARAARAAWAAEGAATDRIIDAILTTIDQWVRAEAA